MGTSSQLTPDLLAEIDNAEQAAFERQMYHHTERRCLKCGGEIVFEDLGSGYRILCKQENRALASGRGI